MGIADGEGVELVHHLYGGEHVFIVGATMVAALSEDGIYAEAPPEEVVFCAAIEKVAIGEVGVGSGGRRERTMAEGAFNHVADTGGAVVAEEVVEIVAVFGEVVGFEGYEEVVDLLRGETELLLPDGTAFVAVFEEEVVEVAPAEAVVEAAAGEGPVEMGDVEIEGAVVIDDIDALDGVADTHGAMAEGGVELVALATGEDGGKGGIGESYVDGVLGLEVRDEEDGEKDDADDFFHISTKKV